MSDKIKKLSDAIRLGSTFRPQCQGKVFDGKGTCVVGAALEAVGKLNPVLHPDGFYYQPLWFSMLRDRFGAEYEIMSEAIARNDEGQTREQIADWLEEQGL